MTPAEKILQKSLAASDMDSRQWSAVQAGLRDRAFFSATVENVRVLHSFRETVAKVAAGEMSESEARTAMRDALTEAGYRRPEGAEGSMRDLMAQRRLDLIVKTNVEQARGWARYMEGTTPGALAAFPAQRLVRVRGRKVPRDWAARWKEAGDAVGWQGASREEMVALKLSPIWVQLSRFGTPYPPFDFNSGMGLEDVGKRKARELGLLDGDAGQGGQTEAKPSQTVPSFNANLKAEMPFMRGDSPEAKWLRSKFGDQIDIHNGEVEWQGRMIQEVRDGTRDKARLGDASQQFLGKLAEVAPAEDVEAFRRMNPTFNRQVFEQHAIKHLGERETRLKDNIPLTPGDYELMPAVWRNPERVVKLKEHHYALELETLDGGFLQLAVNTMRGFASFYKTKAPLGATSGNAPGIPRGGLKTSWTSGRPTV